MYPNGNELDDPSFWAAIAAQVDTTALLHADPLVEVPQYPSNIFPEIERLRLPASQASRAVVPTLSTLVTDVTERDLTAQIPVIRITSQQERVTTSHHPPAQAQQSIWLPIILIGMSALLLLTLMSHPSPRASSNQASVDVGTRFSDTTLEVPNTWNVHCQQSTPQVTTSPYSIIGPSTINAPFINKVLAYYGSPMAGMGQLFVNVSRYCGLDAASVLAFYMHESSFGLSGEARYSLSPGNLRCISNIKCQDGYAWFDSWQDGLMVQCRLLRNLYVDAWGLTTPEQIIPRYAPSADHNDEAAYIYALEHAVETWRHQIVAVS